MDLKDIIPTVIIIMIVGIVIGVGVLVLDQMGIAVKDQDVQITDEVLTLSGGSGTTTNDDIDIDSVILENGTDARLFISGNASTDSRFNITTGGVITYATGIINNGTDWNITYTYDADSTATTAVWTSRDAVDNFVTWLPVIIIIISAAIILGLVLRSFNK